MKTKINGWTASGWEEVSDAFEANFRLHGELGAAVSVYVAGEERLHLWGGHVDTLRDRTWEADTLVQPASAIKGIYSFVIHKLVSDGRLQYEDQVAKYWPEFAQKGKEAATVRHLLGQSAGLETTFPVDLSVASTAEIFRVIELTAPSTPPGQHGAYHSQTLIPLLSALCLKVTGENISTYFRREIAGPWGIDAFLSLPPSETPRASACYAPHGSHYFDLMVKLLKIAPPIDDLVIPVTSLPSEPFASARAFARLWGGVANGGVLDQTRLFIPEVAAACGEPQWTNDSWYPFANPTYRNKKLTGTLGFFAAGGAFDMGPGPKSWGMPGGGGNLAMADPERKIGFGYVLNRWHSGSDLGPRVKCLLDAVYNCTVG